jgi:hypothetical protein
LVVLDSTLWLHESFERFIKEVTNEMFEKYDAISLWPVSHESTGGAKGDGEILEPAGEISPLAFLLTHKGAERFITKLDQNLTLNFSQPVQITNCQCATISPGSSYRPWVYTKLFQGRESYVRSFDNNHIKELLSSEEIKTATLTKKIAIEAYISHWYSTWANVEKIEEACRNSGYKTTVLNTTIQARPGWDNGVPISFFRQLEHACKKFDATNDYMLFITADVKSEQWVEFFEYANSVLQLDNIGTFSPTLTYDWYQLHREGAPGYFDPGSPLAIVNTNDIIVTYIHSSAIAQLREFFDFFKGHSESFNPVVGWGINLALIKINHFLGRINIRDRRYTLLHPNSTSYSHDHARQEMKQMEEISVSFFHQFESPKSSLGPNTGDGASYKKILDQIESFRA